MVSRRDCFLFRHRFPPPLQTHPMSQTRFSELERFSNCPLSPSGLCNRSVKGHQESFFDLPFSADYSGSEVRKSRVQVLQHHRRQTNPVWLLLSFSILTFLEFLLSFFVLHAFFHQNEQN